MKFIFLFTVLFFCTAAFCQVNKQVDSLLNVLDTEQHDSNTLKTLNRIGSYYIDNNPSKAVEYFERAVSIAKKLHNNLRVANAFYDLGFCYLLKNDFDKSLDYYQQSVQIYEQLKDNRRLTNAYLSIGNVFFQSKTFNKAGEYYTKAEAIIQQTKDSGQLASLYGQLGTMYDQNEQYDSALIYLQKSTAIARLINNDYMVTSAMSNMGLTYKHKKNTSLALQYFNSVLQKYTAAPGTPVDNLAVIYNNIGATQSQAGNYAKAIEAFNKSIEYSMQEGLAGIVTENYRNMADMYAAMQDYKQQSNYLQKYYHLKDSIFSNDNKNQLTQLETDYQLQKKNISLVQQQAATASQKNQRNIFITVALGVIVLLAVLAFFYRRSKQNNILLHDKNLQINKQKNELQTLNQVKDRLFSVLSHDLRNPLATLNAYLSLADSPGLPAEKKEHFKKLTVQAVSQTSNMLDNLLVWANMQIKNVKPAVTRLNVSFCIDDALDAVTAQALQKNIQFKKNAAVEYITADAAIVEIALRNIITNAVKYSNPDSTVYISTAAGEQQHFITVKDEGAGMNAAQIEALLQHQNESTAGTHGEKGTGLGLFLVRELLQKINARLAIESEAGKGSSFIIILPAASD